MKTIWHVIRTVIFYMIGLLNTVLIRPEEIGTWKHYLGFLVLALAIFDTIWLIKKYIDHKGATSS